MTDDAGLIDLLFYTAAQVQKYDDHLATVESLLVFAFLLLVVNTAIMLVVLHKFQRSKNIEPATGEVRRSRAEHERRFFEALLKEPAE